MISYELVRRRRPSVGRLERHIEERARAEEGRDDGVDADMARAVIRRPWRRREGVVSGPIPRHKLLQEAGGRNFQGTAEEAQNASTASPYRHSRATASGDKIPTTSSGADTGESRRSVPSTEFDPFHCRKKHIPGRTGILLPNQVEIVGLAAAMAAFHPFPPPAVSEDDVDFLVSLRPQGPTEPALKFQGRTLPCLRRLNWPKLFARFLDAHDLFGHASQDPFVASSGRSPKQRSPHGRIWR